MDARDPILPDLPGMPEADRATLSATINDRVVAETDRRVAQVTANHAADVEAATASGQRGSALATLKCDGRWQSRRQR